jgi:hypothetical protein
VKRCIDIALKCITWKQRDRPTIQEIVTALIETETAIGVPVMQIEQVRYHVNISGISIFIQNYASCRSFRQVDSRR